MASIEFNEPRSVRLSKGSFFRTISRLVKSAQYARFKEVLNAMTDRQLEDIGLQRADIPEFAKQAAGIE